MHTHFRKMVHSTAKKEANIGRFLGFEEKEDYFLSNAE